MSEDAFSQTYRGCDIWINKETGLATTDCLPGLYTDLAFLKERIDELKGEVDIEGIPPADEVLIGVYQGCDIIWYPARNAYGTLCIPDLFGGLYEIRAAIRELTEPDVEIPVDDEEPPPDEVEEPTPELTLPALPWYAAWLKPILTYIGELTESVVNYLTPIWEPIGDVATNILKIPTDAIEALTNAAGDILSRSRDRGASIAVDTLKSVAEGSPQWMLDLQESVATLEQQILGHYNKTLDVETYEKSPLTPGDAAEALVQMKNDILAGAIANFTMHALVEAGSLGQFEFMKELDSMVVAKFGMNALIERATMLPIDKAILVPAEQFWNAAHPNLIPTYTDLINLVVKEVIPLDRFKAEMLKLGFREEWSQFIWDAHFRPPSWEQLLAAYYRGAISEEELMTMKILVDLDPRYDVVWDSLIEVIPAYSELVNELVKEVIDLDEFTKYMRWYGFDEKWAKRIWDAHFIPPALGDILTAWRRGVIDESRVDELMILVDLDPRFKEIFDTRKYIDPSITLARYMFETGAIDETRVQQIVARQGYTPEDIIPITEFIVRFQERRFRTYYLRSLATGAVYGAFTEDEVRAATTEAGYRVEVADWMLKTADARRATSEARRRRPAPKLLNLGDLKKSYARDVINEDVFRRELLIRNFETGDVDLLVTLMNTDKVTTEAGGRKIALSQTELLNAWRYEEVGEDYVRTELLLRGLTTDEVNILLNTKKKQWGVGT